MRPIDADAVCSMCLCHYGECPDREIGECAVSDAPTLTLDDLRPRGRWEKKVVRGKEVPCCSVCGRDTGITYEYDFCPNCGAELDGGFENG